MITNHQQQQQQHEYDRGLRRRFTSTLVCWLGLEILNKLCDQSSVHLPCEEILTSTLVCWLGLDRPLSTEHPERPLHFYSFYTTPSQTPEVGKLAPHGDHLGPLGTTWGPLLYLLYNTISNARDGKTRTLVYSYRLNSKVPKIGTT